MLQLLSLLQTHRYWPGTELADRLEVSPRTLRRDVDRLRGLGYPVRSERGSGGGYQLQAGAALPPLLLDDEEAVAIAVGLATAAGGSVAGIEESAVRALAKVVQVMPPRLRRRADALRSATSTLVPSGPTVDAAALTALAQACRDAERVRFAYEPRGRPAAARHVEPHRLVALGRRWYLLAWDVERHDWRSFRVDRLRDPLPTGARFRPREVPGGDPAAFVRASFDALPTRYDVRVLVRAPGDEVRRAVSRWGQVEDVDAGSCRVRMGVDDLQWPLMLLAGVGAPFTVEGPDELTALVGRTADLFAASAA
ncbi:YafY family transcriptional regulator [Vallicoccus soli]|uniref:YafY family transcriptional regulator n=2 Tax=Vallicoccus soli TaxID=2339232 RepID=A0A3A3YZB6_9ACTN|nr:YafY family transcriptional regulator [Vallicoccus soli]